MVCQTVRHIIRTKRNSMVVAATDTTVLTVYAAEVRAHLQRQSNCRLCQNAIILHYDGGTSQYL